MDFLQTNKKQIVKEDGAPFYLRGLCVGGWMNMENFINGYPGTEISLREHVCSVSVTKRAHCSSTVCWQHFFPRKTYVSSAQTVLPASASP